MKVSIRIPIAFRELAGGNATVPVSAATVEDAVSELIRLYPAIQDRIRDPDGSRKKTLGVYLNREDVRFHQGMDTPLSEGDEVMLLPPASGG